MKSTLVTMPNRKKVIAPSDWGIKKLADAHVEGLFHCEFKCCYCSSNSGRHIFTVKPKLDKAVQDATGEDFDPHHSDGLVIGFENVPQALEQELNKTKKKPGKGKTLVYSQLTDGFSPTIVRDGTTRRILELLIEKTEYRIRILTKNSVVGTQRWIKFFAAHPERFVVGLSVGTLDDKFAKKLEKGTSSPTSRIKALHALQDAGVPTYGMMCPVFLDVLATDELERLIERIRPNLCEHVWAEPFNDRQNWQVVRDCFSSQSPARDRLDRIFGAGDTTAWSEYATELYKRILKSSRQGGWTSKLRYLLYEQNIAKEHVECFEGLEGVLLQSIDKKTKESRNPGFVPLQTLED